MQQLGEHGGVVVLLIPRGVNDRQPSLLRAVAQLLDQLGVFEELAR
jgi:hypothetical protein